MPDTILIIDDEAAIRETLSGILGDEGFAPLTAGSAEEGLQLLDEKDVDLVLRVQPAKRFFLKTNTSVGQSEGTASIQGKVRNVFGGAETLEGSATLGTRTRHAYHAVFSTPVLASPDVWANVSALAQHRDLTGYLSAHEGLHTLRAACMVRAVYSPQMLGQDGVRNELAYEASHRHFHHLLPRASVAYVGAH